MDKNSSVIVQVIGKGKWEVSWVGSSVWIFCIDRQHTHGENTRWAAIVEEIEIQWIGTKTL